MHPAEKLRTASEPIQTEAIDRLRRLGQDPDGEPILDAVVSRFRQEATQWRGELRGGVASDDLAAVRRIAHTLRGSASILGATRLVQACGMLETWAAQGSTEDGATRLRSLEAALMEVLVALSQVERGSVPRTPKCRNTKSIH